LRKLAGRTPCAIVVATPLTSPSPSRPPRGGRFLLTSLVAYCAAHAWLIAVLALALGAGALGFTVSHFSLSSDTEGMISPKLAWRQREVAFNHLFQNEGGKIVVVIDGATPELAEEASADLAARLSVRTDLFRQVQRPGAYFQREGLLYEPLDQVRSQLAQLISAQPFLGPLAADPSLRGLAGTLSTAVKGVSAGQAKLGQLAGPIGGLAKTLDDLRAGKPAFFSWRALISGKTPDQSETRQIIVASPVLNYAALMSGASASDEIRKDAKAMAYDPAHGVRVRLTGDVPLQDEEFASLSEHWQLIAALAGAAILIMLWFAVRSPRIILAIMVTTLLGLVCAAAAGLLIFRTFNIISVAFIPLFVGLGIDFGIQFSVRFRSEHKADTPVVQALIASGEGMGRSLTLAAAAIASGFLAFAPTDYRGVSQLGVIAGLGMVIALLLNLSVLPALLRLLAPPAAPPKAQADPLESLDHVILSHRRAVVGTAVVAALICAASLPLLHFDFNTLHLMNAKTESVTTLLSLMSDPDENPNTMEVVTPNLSAADALVPRLAGLPQVAHARTLSSFVPDDQAPKLAAIGDAAQLLDLTLDPIVLAPPPTDAETVAALTAAASDLRAAAAQNPASAGAAQRLAADFDWLAAAPPGMRARADGLLMSPLKTVLAQTSLALTAGPVTLASLPASLTRDWVAPDGRARISMVPKGDSNNNKVLIGFIEAVRRVAPDSTGAALDIMEAGRTVSGAFAEAGLLSFIVITALLFAVLRRVRDVAITMAPIVLTGLLTLGTCVAIGQPLNFANIIALPLLFGIGVAFHIYFVMAWRAGGSHLLQSSLSRAVFFSALATATGFGSLWASSHPGTASMGKLLMISLVWTLVSALLFQPALMGPPPEEKA
jgi:hopanoid biosynthesis associated RND transporter like protein HpnN